MEHVINAKYGDTIVIKIPHRPRVILQKITMPVEVNETISPNEIISDVCAALGITLKDLQSKRKTSELVTARFYIANKLREAQFALSVIGKLLNRDHTSVMHAVRTYQNRISAKDSLTINTINIIKDYETAKG